MRRYQKGMVLMVEHILFAVLTAAVIGAAIFMWWFENHDEKSSRMRSARSTVDQRNGCRSMCGKFQGRG